MNIGAIVMAAGLGTRMKSHVPKVLHHLCGKPLLFYTLDLLKKAEARKVAIVVNHKKEEIIKTVEGHYNKNLFTFVDQKKPLGTGHAVLMTEKVFKNFKSPIVILSGDSPLLSFETLCRFVTHHTQRGMDLTMGTCLLNPSIPYGRIIHDESGRVTQIIEAIDASPEELQIREMNIGLYCAESTALFNALKNIRPNNKKGEYYLTDIAKMISKNSKFCIEKKEEVLGINSRVDLANMERYMKEDMNQKWMEAGVTIIDPQTTYIDPEAKIGRDVILHPQTHIKGKTTIGEGTTVGIGAILLDAEIGSQVKIEPYTVIEESRVDDYASLGPFARLRPGTHIKSKARVGNFVELKKTVLGEGSKANHLSYLGDAEIGRDVNIGCGVITCNYDGGLRYQGKAKTKVGDKSFIGSDCQLVAPIILSKGSYIASGTTVTKNVPPDSLVIARPEQVTKKGYMKKLWAKAKKKKG